MKNGLRARRAALVTGAATLLVVALNPPVALANTDAPALVSVRNSSDPQIETCTVREGGVDKTYMCLFTSSDMDVLHHNPSDWFPMEATYAYTFDTTSGRNPGEPGTAADPNWVDRSGPGGAYPAFHEDWLPFSTKNHLWAPTMHYGNKTGENLLYVPDAYDNVIVPGVSQDGHVAYIAVATTYYSDRAGTSGNNAPWGQFRYLKNVTYKGAEVNLTYMSDPAVVTLADTHPIIDNAYVDGNGNVQYPPDYHPTGGPATWLLWADGDYNQDNPMDCGGLSIGRLNDNDFTDLVDDPRKNGIAAPRRNGPSDIQINGIAEALGTCPNAFHPYLEGPELYDLSQLNLPLLNGNERFMLMFAAKPEPTRYIGGDPTMPSSYLPSAHGDGNQVLAWTTSSNPRGPYTYRGILMDSSTTSWTNHGSLYADTITVNTATAGQPVVQQSQPRFIMFWHDEAGGNPHDRRARAVCLQYDLSDKKFITAVRPTTSPNLRPPSEVAPVNARGDGCYSLVA